MEADVVDDAGTIVRNTHPWIHFEITGPGHFLGEMVDIDTISGVAGINLQTDGDKGEITVTASSPGLQTGMVKVVSQ